MKTPLAISSYVVRMFTRPQCWLALGLVVGLPGTCVVAAAGSTLSSFAIAAGRGR